jgi:GcrA cell cycle regulator
MGVISQHYFDWSDEAVARLKALWADGYSAAQVAAILGCDSRSAVCGKIGRLGITRDGKPVLTEEEKRQRQEEYNASRRQNRRVLLRPGRSSAYGGDLQVVHDHGLHEAPAIDDLAIPKAQRRTLLELTQNTCRWPVGDPGSPDFFFCGAAPKHNMPYCPTHCARAFQASKSPAEHRPYRGP